MDKNDIIKLLKKIDELQTILIEKKTEDKLFDLYWYTKLKENLIEARNSLNDIYNSH